MSAVTIVLTLKDRSPFTYRWMRYMNDRRCPHPILIADGGIDPDVEGRLRHGANYPHLRYEYLRYPVDVDHASYYRKLADAVSRVETPYTLLADNDDFFLLDALPAMTNFLDAHDGYVSCGGQRVVLRLMNDGALTGGDTGSSYEARIDARPKAIVHAESVRRMQYFLENVRRLYLWASWYCVHRTSALMAATGIARTHAFSDPVAHEIHVHLSLLRAGSTNQLDQPFFVNQAGSSQFTSALEAKGSVAERFAASTALSDLRRSIDAIAPPLSEGDRATINGSIDTWLALQAGKTAGAPPWQPIRLPVLEPYILCA